MAKRMNGEGHLRQRADGRWEYRIMSGFLADGRRNVISFYGRTQREVKAKVAEYQRMHTYGLDTSVKHTFASWADLWFENHKSNISATTQENYKYILAALKQGLGTRKLQDIKPFDIEQFLRTLKENGKSKSYLANARGMLFQIFHKAEANDLIIKNPVRYAEKMRDGVAPPKVRDAFHADEVRRLVDLLPTDRMGCSIRLLLATGMRVQELLALEPQFIAEDGSVIKICQALKRVRGSVEIGPPKSQDGYRNIPVPASFRWCAIYLRDTDDKYIWESSRRDSPINPSTFSKNFTKALEDVGEVRLLTPHSCRHTYVSQMQALGVDLATIQSIVGHADMDMTMHYLHVQEPVRNDAANRFSEAFGQPEPPTPQNLKVI